MTPSRGAVMADRGQGLAMAWPPLANIGPLLQRVGVQYRRSYAA